MRIAFIGLGRMGSELVAHIVDAGHDVTVWNRSPEKAKPVVERGARLAESAAAAVEGAELVLTTLFGPDTVREAILGGDLAFAANAVWVDITTVSPADTGEFASWARGIGLTYVHSPVIGSLGPARERALGVLVGGPHHGVERALPVVSLWADPERLRVVDTPAKAAAGKLVANLALATAMQGVAEAIRLGAGGGLSPEEVLEQLADKTPLAAIAGLKGELVRSGDYGRAQFSANALAKDAGLMVWTATGPLPALTAAYTALEAAKAAGRGEEDFAVIAEVAGTAGVAAVASINERDTSRN